MVVCIADNITSPLGVTTRQNVEAVRQGRSVLASHCLWGMPEAFVGSLFAGAEAGADAEIVGADGQPFRRDFDSLVLHSIREALSHVPSLDLRSERLGLVLASTKGDTTEPHHRDFATSAAHIATSLGIRTRPVTVSNACISGLSAQIVAHRLIEAGDFDTVIVAGCDVQTKFIVSGFQSFKALSTEACRPFDEDRFGLNLGEAAATMILTRRERSAIRPDDWVMVSGAVRNDAFHISGPSRTAEGSYRALRQVLRGEDSEQLACCNAHGTATLYNDDMESKAIDRAGLAAVPVNSLKGYFGHTMGAAGVLETVITMRTIDEGWVAGTRGFCALGTSRTIRVVAEHEPTHRRSFVKLMSGFGGCNAAALYKKGDQL